MAEIASPVPQVPVVDEPVSAVGQLSQWTLMRLRYGRNKLAMVGLIGLVLMYLLVFFGPFIAPNEYTIKTQITFLVAPVVSLSSVRTVVLVYNPIFTK